MSALAALSTTMQTFRPGGEVGLDVGQTGAEPAPLDSGFQIMTAAASAASFTMTASGWMKCAKERAGPTPPASRMAGHLARSLSTAPEASWQCICTPNPCRAARASPRRRRSPSVWTPMALNANASKERSGAVTARASKAAAKTSSGGRTVQHAGREAHEIPALARCAVLLSSTKPGASGRRAGRQAIRPAFFRLSSWRMSCASLRNTISSAMLVAWSAMRSRPLLINMSSRARVMVPGCSTM